MTVYVDSERIKWRGREWCHLVADDLDELHAFASSLGLKRAWFQNKRSCPHYDITMPKKQKALTLGACELDRHEMSKKIREIRQSLKNEQARG